MFSRRHLLAFFTKAVHESKRKTTLKKTKQTPLSVHNQCTAILLHLVLSFPNVTPTDEIKIYMSKNNFPTRKGKIRQKHGQAFRQMFHSRSHWRQSSTWPEGSHCPTPNPASYPQFPFPSTQPTPSPVPFSMPQCRARLCSCVMGAGSQ